MTTLQKTIIGATLAAAIGTGIYEARQAANARVEVETLQQQQALLTEQIQKLQHERDDATNQLAGLLAENSRLKSNPNQAELLRLHAALARLRAVENDPTALAARNWLAKVNQLKQRFEETPGARIPELEFLTELDWLELANTKLETEADYRKAMGEIRKRGESYFVRKVQSALSDYMRANNGEWPSDISQLKPYFTSPVDDAMLQRWEIVSKAALPNQKFAGDWVIIEKSPTDREFDHRWTVDGPFSAGVGPYQHQPSKEEEQKVLENEKIETMKKTLEPVLKAYAEAHEGQEPPDPYRLQPYLTTPEQRAALETITEIIAAKKSRGE